MSQPTPAADVATQMRELTAAVAQIQKTQLQLQQQQNQLMRAVELSNDQSRERFEKLGDTLLLLMEAMADSRGQPLEPEADDDDDDDSDAGLPPRQATATVLTAAADPGPAASSTSRSTPTNELFVPVACPAPMMDVTPPTPGVFDEANFDLPARQATSTYYVSNDGSPARTPSDDAPAVGGAWLVAEDTPESSPTVGPVDEDDDGAWVMDQRTLTFTAPPAAERGDVPTDFFAEAEDGSLIVTDA